MGWINLILFLQSNVFGGLLGAFLTRFFSLGSVNFWLYLLICTFIWLLCTHMIRTLIKAELNKRNKDIK
jgi:hypothetical protein